MSVGSRSLLDHTRKPRVLSVVTITFSRLLERNVDLRNSPSTLRSFLVRVAYFSKITPNHIELFSLFVERVSPVKTFCVRFAAIVARDHQRARPN